MKYIVSERTGSTWDEGERVVGVYPSFEEALDAGRSVCADLCHEGEAKDNHSYWMSDEESESKPYKVRIFCGNKE